MGAIQAAGRAQEKIMVAQCSRCNCRPATEGLSWEGKPICGICEHNLTYMRVEICYADYNIDKEEIFNVPIERLPYLTPLGYAIDDFYSTYWGSDVGNPDQKAFYSLIMRKPQTGLYFSIFGERRDMAMIANMNFISGFRERFDRVVGNE